MAKEFQSELFKNSSFESKEFKAFEKDIEISNKIDKKNWPKTIKILKELIFLESEIKKEELKQELIKNKFVNNTKDISSLGRLFYFFVKEFSEKETQGDSLDNLIHDISILQGVDKEKLGSVEEFFKLINKETSWYKNKIKELDHEVGLLPILKTIKATVELRGVFDSEIKTGEEIDSYIKRTKLDKNTPIVPIISVKIGLNTGTNNEFYFQTSPKRLEFIIERLQAVLHRSKLLTESYKK